MSDTVKSWVEERHKRRNALGHQGLIFVPDEDGNATLWHDGERVGARDEGVRSLVDAHNMFPRALTALEQVLELHSEDVYGECSSCVTAHGAGMPYPCPTVEAIEGAIEGAINGE